ncbi:hypothetical protein QE152_g1678 [Popillia japonica]|uniref:Uncharacterized protein n=1 Tax=Popillia japonica TaxID=7064 RepID=A0AAW1N6R4_POPJA
MTSPKSTEAKELEASTLGRVRFWLNIQLIITTIGKMTSPKSTESKELEGSQLTMCKGDNRTPLHCSSLTESKELEGSQLTMCKGDNRTPLHCSSLEVRGHPREASSPYSSAK